VTSFLVIEQVAISLHVVLSSGEEEEGIVMQAGKERQKWFILKVQDD
jgi:hypothetical protein